MADRLGIPVGTLYDWNKKRTHYTILGEDAPPSGPLTEEEKEIWRLQRENRNLEDALAIQKKPSAFWETDRVYLRSSTGSCSDRYGTPDLCQRSAEALRCFKKRLL